MTTVRAVVLTIALWLVAVSPAAAATEPEFEVKFDFVGCEAVNGSYFTWSPFWHPSRDAAYAEVVELGGPDTAKWGASSPLAIAQFAPVYPPEEGYEDAGYATGEVFFVLLAPDRTVVYETVLTVRHAPNRAAYFAMRATLDCSSVPYRAVAMPDAAMPAPNRLTSVGGLILCVVAAVFVGRRCSRSGGERYLHRD